MLVGSHDNRSFLLSWLGRTWVLTHHSGPSATLSRLNSYWYRDLLRSYSLLRFTQSMIAAAYAELMDGCKEGPGGRGWGQTLAALAGENPFANFVENSKVWASHF